MPKIEKFPSKAKTTYKFSIVIPSWNNLAYLKLCVESLLKNSHFQHQLIIHVNAGTDGTLEWVKESGLDYTYSVDNVGICFPLNYARTLMTTDYFVYMNDDMYACPDWDLALWKVIQSTDSKLFFYSATMLEPHKSLNTCVIAPVSFGETPETFDEAKLLRDYQSEFKEDWLGATWPPNIVHRDTWDLVGGYSVEFSPGMSSDPDFSKKLWEAGVRDFRGIGASRVYHFGSKTTGRIDKNPGGKQFLLKWGITSATFTNTVLRRGQLALGLLAEPTSWQYQVQVFKSKVKRFFTF